jgi:hypothetical protein
MHSTEFISRPAFTNETNIPKEIQILQQYDDASSKNLVHEIIYLGLTLGFIYFIWHYALPTMMISDSLISTTDPYTVESISKLVETIHRYDSFEWWRAARHVGLSGSSNLQIALWPSIKQTTTRFFYPEGSFAIGKQSFFTD